MTRFAQAATTLTLVALLAPAKGHARSGDAPMRARIDPERLARLRIAARRARALGVRAPAHRVALSRARRARPRVRPAPPKPMALKQRRTVGWGAGEALTYRVRLLGVEIARAALSVGKPKGRKVKLRGRGETIPLIKLIVPLREDLSTVIDLDGMRPLRTKSHRHEGAKERTINTVHRRWTADVRRRQALVEQTLTRVDPTRPTPRVKRPARPRVRRLAGPVLDALTALQLVRSAKEAELRGEGLRLYVLDGTALFAVDLKLGGRQRLQTALGPLDCIRVDGVGWRIHDDGRRDTRKRTRKGSLWLTADARRVPVRLQGDTKFGFVTADVTTYRPARGALIVRLPRSGASRKSSDGS